MRIAGRERPHSTAKARREVFDRESELAMGPSDSGLICDARSGGDEELRLACVVAAEEALQADRRAILARWLGPLWADSPPMDERGAWLERGWELLIEKRRQMGVKAMPDLLRGQALLRLNIACADEATRLQSLVIKREAAKLLNMFDQ